MEFKINNDTWTIVEKTKDQLKKIYEENMEEKAYFVFGVTKKAEHEIIINSDMCKEQKIRTLKHELTHCYMWEYGLYNAEPINEELVCDIVSASNDFINEVVNKWREYECKSEHK